MRDKIKRVAQFLFDNAEFISETLAESDKFRALSVEIHHHKSGNGDTKSVELSIYDERCSHYKLKDDLIGAERFALVCEAMNIEVGEIKPPSQVDLRESLDYQGSTYDKISKKAFGKPYDELHDENQIVVRDLFDQKEE